MKRGKKGEVRKEERERNGKVEGEGKTDMGRNLCFPKCALFELKIGITFFRV